MLWNRLIGSAVAGGWDISKATFVQSFSVAAQETIPANVFFKPDGTRMYVIGTAGDDVNEYQLTSAWDSSTASYVRVFSVSGKETTPEGLFFSGDGTQMYIVGIASDSVHQYAISTAWNVSTASFTRSLNVSAQDVGPRSVFFSPDGTRMYVLGAAGLEVNQYALSSAWDISSASYVRNAIPTSVIDPRGIFFKPDGKNMFLVDAGAQAVREYALSSSWDISTFTFVRALDVSLKAVAPRGVFFRDDGLQMFVICSATDSVHEYTL